MNTKLTLRIDEATVRKAKMEAKRRGKSVSRMVADFIITINTKDFAGSSLKVCDPTEFLALLE
jgi:hypothetical protein